MQILGPFGIWGALSRFHPVVMTAWGSDILIDPNKNCLSKLLTEYTLRKADLIIDDGKNIEKAMVRLGVASSKIRTISFGIDIQKFSLPQQNEKPSKESNPKDHFSVISLRNFEPVYNLETLIESIPLVLKELPSVKFILIGRGSEEKKIKILAEELGIFKSIQFVGWIPNEETAQHLKTADVYVSTSLSDGGLAVSTAEAMACGLPVIVTDSGDNKLWIEDGENGFVVPIKNPEAIANRVIHLLKNKSMRSKFGEINRGKIEENYNYFKEMNKVKKLYEEIVKGTQK